MIELVLSKELAEAVQKHDLNEVHNLIISGAGHLDVTAESMDRGEWKRKRALLTAPKAGKFLWKGIRGAKTHDDVQANIIWWLETL